MPTISTLGQVRELPWEADQRRFARQDYLMGQQQQTKNEAAKLAYDIAMAQLGAQKEQGSLAREDRLAAQKAQSDYMTAMLGLEREKMLQNKPKTAAERAADLAAAHKAYSGIYGQQDEGANPNMVFEQNPMAATARAVAPMFGETVGRYAEMALASKAGKKLLPDELNLQRSMENEVMNPSPAPKKYMGVDASGNPIFQTGSAPLDRLAMLDALKRGRKTEAWQDKTAAFQRAQQEQSMAEQALTGSPEAKALDVAIANAKTPLEKAQLMSRKYTLMKQPDAAKQALEVAPADLADVSAQYQGMQASAEDLPEDIQLGDALNPLKGGPVGAGLRAVWRRLNAGQVEGQLGNMRDQLDMVFEDAVRKNQDIGQIRNALATKNSSPKFRELLTESYAKALAKRGGMRAR